MPQFTPESAIFVLELQHLVASWCQELDMNGGNKISSLCTQDCNYLIGGTAYNGHIAIDAFYAARNDRVRDQQKDGVRTQRHTTSNLRVSFGDALTATISFSLVNYSAEGKAPAYNLTGPTIIADCRFDCRREADGEWRIAEFDSMPVFIGNDPFLNAAVVQPSTSQIKPQEIS